MVSDPTRNVACGQNYMCFTSRFGLGVKARTATDSFTLASAGPCVRSSSHAQTIYFQIPAHPPGPHARIPTLGRPFNWSQVGLVAASYCSLLSSLCYTTCCSGARPCARFWDVGMIITAAEENQLDPISIALIQKYQAFEGCGRAF